MSENSCVLWHSSERYKDGKLNINDVVRVSLAFARAFLIESLSYKLEECGLKEVDF